MLTKKNCVGRELICAVIIFLGPVELENKTKKYQGYTMITNRHMFAGRVQSLYKFSTLSQKTKHEM